MGKDINEYIGRKIYHEMYGEGMVIKSISSFLVFKFDGKLRALPYPECMKQISFNVKEKVIAAANMDPQENENLNKRKVLVRQFVDRYSDALEYEIAAQKKEGGKKYSGYDGRKIKQSGIINVYSFDTDTELHLQDGTEIQVYFGSEMYSATLQSSEEYTIIISLREIYKRSTS